MAMWPIPSVFMLLLLRELVFVCSAYRADIIFGEVFEGCAGLYAVVGVAYFGVILPSAYIAYILFHNVLF